MSIQIRGIRHSDHKGLVTLMSCRGVINGLSVMPYVSEYDVETLIKPNDNRHWLIGEEDGKVAGFLYLEWGRGRWRNIATLAMAVHDDHVGKGIGRRLLEVAIAVGFGYLDLRKIELVVYVDNAPARRLYERVGFVHEGTKRGNAIRNGIYVDAHVMSMLRVDASSAGHLGPLKLTMAMPAMTSTSPAI